MWRTGVLEGWVGSWLRILDENVTLLVHHFLLQGRSSEHGPICAEWSYWLGTHGTCSWKEKERDIPMTENRTVCPVDSISALIISSSWLIGILSSSFLSLRQFLWLGTALETRLVRVRVNSILLGVRVSAPRLDLGTRGARWNVRSVHCVLGDGGSNCFLRKC